MYCVCIPEACHRWTKLFSYFPQVLMSLLAFLMCSSTQLDAVFTDYTAVFREFKFLVIFHFKRHDALCSFLTIASYGWQMFTCIKQTILLEPHVHCCSCQHAYLHVLSQTLSWLLLLLSLESFIQRTFQIMIRTSNFLWYSTLSCMYSLSNLYVM